MASTAFSTVEKAVMRITSVSGLCSLMRREQRDAIVVGQAEVEQHQIDLRCELRHRLRAGAGFEQVVIVPAESLAQRPPDQRFVVNDENGCCGHKLKYTDEKHAQTQSPD